MLLVVVSIELRAAGAECPAVPVKPERTERAAPEQPRSLDPYSIAQTVSHYYDAPLGLGFLEVIDEQNRRFYDWMFEVELPLWQGPDEMHPLGWLSRGEIFTASGVEPLTGAGMVETGYERTSFIVWDSHADWLKLRLTGDLYAWSHRCHLEAEGIRLEYVAWQSFLRRHSDWLHFRKPVPHVLRAAPGTESDRVTTIGLNHKLVMLDIRGDWMQVEVEQPDLTCNGSDADKGQVARHHGWVKWRDERGPWVYIYTRGC